MSCRKPGFYAILILCSLLLYVCYCSILSQLTTVFFCLSYLVLCRCFVYSVVVILLYYLVCFIVWLYCFLLFRDSNMPYKYCFTFMIKCTIIRIIVLTSLNFLFNILCLDKANFWLIFALYNSFSVNSFVLLCYFWSCFDCLASHFLLSYS